MAADDLPLPPDPGAANDEVRALIDRRVLSFVIESVATNGYAPTTREIQLGCGLRSESAARTSVHRLVSAGRLDAEPGKARGLVVPGSAAEVKLAEERGLDVLEFFGAMERGYYPYLCRAAALTPDLDTAQAWLELVASRVRQLKAIEYACTRLRDRHENGGSALTREIQLIWRGLEAHCATFTSWWQWIALEDVESRMILDRGFPTNSHPAAGMIATALEGNLITALEGQRLVQSCLATIDERTPSGKAIRREYARARSDCADVYAQLAHLIDQVWPPD